MNKQRFNEAVARGDYPCAPAVSGRARVFAARDVFGLWLYGLLSDDGIPPAKAGELACQLVEVMRQRPDLGEVVLVRGAFRRRYICTPDEVESLIKSVLGGSYIVGIETINLCQVRANIAHQFDRIARPFIQPDATTDED